jgi:riboflavin transporter FmnP
MANSLALKQDLILLPVVGLMTVIDTIAGMIVEAVDDMIVVVETADDLIGVVVVVIDTAIGGVAIETKNNRKHKV